jgi:uncharacterized membrane protein
MPDRTRARGLLVGAAVAAVLAVGVLLRFWVRSPLWLDEALTVNIARLPFDQLFERLRHDGHPPLYYLLLHVWMAAFGEGDRTVRALSGLLAVVTFVPAWIVGRRLGGRACAAAFVVLLATSPFAVRYGTETRMYSLVMLLVLLGWLAVRAALDRPTIARLVPVAVLSGLLALTHYWAFYLLAATVLALGLAWRRGSAAALRVGIGIMAGAVLFLPWLPSFLVQSGSTGTPWGRPERPTGVLAISFTDWSGGPNGEAITLSYCLLLLVLAAIFARRIDGRRLELDLMTQPGVRAEALVVVGTMGIAVVAGFATNSAFASRYTAVVFPLVLLLAAWGLLLLPRRSQAVAVVVLAVLGLAGSYRNVNYQRSQSRVIAAYISENGSPGDVVAYCPDQLGPAVSRELPSTFRQLSFPNGGDPHFVDWEDYADQQRAGDPNAFADRLDQLGGQHTVWVVWQGQYRTLGQRCERLAEALRTRHRPGGGMVVPSGSQFEHAWVWQYGPVPPEQQALLGK